MYQALYRSFRPETFEDLLGQEHIVKILKNQIKTGTTAHAYIFCGTRGTGKTTTARLLAKALNCTEDDASGRPCGTCANCKAIAQGSFIDVTEIDAASNNGVDDVRDLREEVNYPPMLGRNKVYIIDEAHMLSTAAFNALLKTLEEPPEHTVFILATTEPGRLPATIQSRCIRLDFKRVSEAVIEKHLADICAQLGVEAESSALALIASNADGSVRDSLSLLDRCLSAGKKITRDDVLFLLGMSGIETYIDITEYVLAGDAGQALTAFNDELANGKEALQFARDWVEHFRDLMLVKYVKNPENILNLSTENIERLKVQSDKTSMDRIQACITELSKALLDARYSPKSRVLLEMAIIRMATWATC